MFGYLNFFSYLCKKNKTMITREQAKKICLKYVKRLMEKVKVY